MKINIDGKNGRAKGLREYLKAYHWANEPRVDTVYPLNTK